MKVARTRFLAFLSLFTSASTLVCCALPALFVALGMGAAFAGLVTRVPQLVWVSEHKLWFFGAGAVMIAAAGVAQWRARRLPCPADFEKARACGGVRRWSRVTYLASVAVYFVGLVFASL